MASRTYDSKTFHQLVKKQRNKGNNFISDLYVGNEKYTRTQGILEGFQQHFEQLALSKEDVNFDAEHHKLNKYEFSIITEFVKDNNISDITMNELEKAIKSINKGKAADIYGLTIEHILNAGKEAVMYILVLINLIFHTGDIPELLKTGVLTPVFKKKGSKNCSTNYRGITILPVLCKIIEAILKEQISSQCDKAQNPYQRGFTRNASPMNAGLIVEVRQGGIVSTDLYKIYQNRLLNRIQHFGLGARVGNVTCNIIGCADDLAVNVNSHREGQVLVNASTDNCNLERYLLRVDKSVIVTVTPRDSNNAINITEPITMNGKEMKTVESAMHLRIHRTTTISKTSELNVKENLKKARIVVYSLMSSGMHGHNGLDPETNLHLVKTYLLPVLLYGLELVLPCKTLKNKLETYHKKMLKQI